jgi:hypothetical protein
MKPEQGWCVPNSIWNAFVQAGKTKRPVRIATFHTDDPNVNHVQAQVQTEGGEWIPLSEFWNGECLESRPWRDHIEVTGGREAFKYQGLVEFFTEQAAINGIKD